MMNDPCLLPQWPALGQTGIFGMRMKMQGPPFEAVRDDEVMMPRLPPGLPGLPGVRDEALMR